VKNKALWSKLPKIDVIEENLRLFWYFVAERQRIWHRRFVEKTPPPWTEDKILRDYKFTNVYRDLDRGTIWYVENIYKPLKKLEVEEYDKVGDILWLTVMYRLLNRVETFEEVGLLHEWGWKERRKEWAHQLRELHKHQSVFTNAHLTLPTNKAGKSKITRYIEVLDKLHKNLPEVVNHMNAATSLEEAFHVFKHDILCVGPFISYEICCDLMMVGVLPFTENDWVNPGPGCRRGLRLIFPKTDTTADFQSRIRFLQRNQEESFAENLLHFYKWNNRDLTLRSIEHSLCEFGKYYGMLHGAGKSRMHFKPTQTKFDFREGM